MDLDTAVEVIERYYRSRCNDTWEHKNGFRIESCDNPGWMLLLTDQKINNLRNLHAGQNLITGTLQGLVTDDGISLFSSVGLKELIVGTAEQLINLDKTG
jgi:hypothetical protein